GTMILAKVAALARPVRIAPNSSRACAMARSIFSSASRRISSITFSPSCCRSVCCRRVVPSYRSTGSKQRPGLFITTDRLDDGVRAFSTEDQHRQVVLHTQTERRRVNHPEPLPQGFGEGDGVELTGGRVGPRVGGVDAVHSVLTHQDRV